jgi:hypothetical protein
MMVLMKVFCRRNLLTCKTSIVRYGNSTPLTHLADAIFSRFWPLFSQYGITRCVELTMIPSPFLS